MKKQILNQGLSSSAFEVKPPDISKENLLSISFKIILKCPVTGKIYTQNNFLFQLLSNRDNRNKDLNKYIININKQQQKLFMNKIFNVHTKFSVFIIGY